MKLPKELSMNPIVIRHRGYLDMEKIQKAMHDWYKENDFYPFDVTKLKLVRFPTGIKIKIVHKGSKNVTEYVKWQIDCLTIVYEIEDVEIIKEGKKIQSQYGKFSATITGSLQLDWQKRFGGNKFLQFLGDFLRNYILRYKIVDHWADQICLKMDELANVIKKALGAEVI